MKTLTEKIRERVQIAWRGRFYSSWKERRNLQCMLYNLNNFLIGLFDPVTYPPERAFSDGLAEYSFGGCVYPISEKETKELAEAIYDWMEEHEMTGIVSFALYMDEEGDV